MSIDNNQTQSSIQSSNSKEPTATWPYKSQSYYKGISSANERNPLLPRSQYLSGSYAWMEPPQSNYDLFLKQQIGQYYYVQPNRRGSTSSTTSNTSTASNSNSNVNSNNTYENTNSTAMKQVTRTYSEILNRSDRSYMEEKYRQSQRPIYSTTSTAWSRCSSSPILNQSIDNTNPNEKTLPKITQYGSINPPPNSFIAIDIPNTNEKNQIVSEHQIQLVSKNQSETDSDSDGSTKGNLIINTDAPLQSILRLRTLDGEIQPRNTRKHQSSVEFRLDESQLKAENQLHKQEMETNTQLDDEMMEDELLDWAAARRAFFKDPSLIPPRRFSRRKTPRRLTAEEKEILYQIRPDLESNRPPLIVLRELELLRQRRQTHVIFTLLGGTLILLLILVIYYLLVLCK